MSKIDVTDLKAKQLEVLDSIRSLEDRAMEEERDLTDEEAGEIENMLGEAEKISAQIVRREKLERFEANLSSSAGRKTETTGSALNARDGAKVTGGTPNFKRDTAKWGFKNEGEFYQAVYNSSRRGNGVDSRLIANAPSTYSSEGVGADGGFAVPPDFRSAIIEKVMGEASLLSRTDNLTTGSNTVTFPVSEVTPWDTTSGVQAYWENEAGQKGQSKVKLEPRTYRLNKLISLCPVTDELLEDASTLGPYLTRSIPQKMDFAINLALVQGTGVGQPLGILNSASLVSVAKESGQSADTILPENIFNMWSRMYGPSRTNAVWLINQDIEPQLFNLKFSGTTVDTPVYLPAGGLSGAPYSSLMGRPIIPTQACNTLGDQGDIILVDLKQYMTVTKGGGPRSDVSIHLFFDYDVTAFRTVFRLTGAPWWGSAISPRDGSNTLSWAVTLDERA